MRRTPRAAYRSDRSRSAAPSAARPASRSNETSSVPATSGRTPKRGVGEERRPLGAEEELRDRHFAQEADGLHRQDDDDADRRADREQGAAGSSPHSMRNSNRLLPTSSDTLVGSRSLFPRAAARGSGRPAIHPRRTPCRPCVRRSASSRGRRFAASARRSRLRASALAGTEVRRRRTSGLRAGRPPSCAT